MSDPKRYKKLGRITATVKYEELNNPTQLNTNIDGEIFKNVPKEVIEERVKQDIAQVSLKEGAYLYKTHVSFSYSDKEVIKDFDFGNILTEIFLPYCLHLPNQEEIVINIPKQGIKALVIHQKVWTNRAKTEDGESDKVDIYADDLCLYHKNSTILGPVLPYQPELGWDSFITGRNIEKADDQNGVFRFSKILMQFDLDIPADVDSLSDKSRDKLFMKIREIALLVINHLVDNYRDITDEIHVRRLGSLKLNMIYFVQQNKGFYMTDLNVKTAMMNRSGKEIQELHSRLKSGKKPDLYKLLLQNARSSCSTNDFTLAIVESFQALEIFLENYLISEFKKRGDKKSDYLKILDKYWRTKERLNEVLNIVKKVTLNKQKDKWDKWCHHYDKTRNEVIHGGREPTEEGTKGILEINGKVIDWILSLS